MSEPQVFPTGPDPDMTEVNAACHCGAVRMRVRLSDGLRTARPRATPSPGSPAPSSSAGRRWSWPRPPC